MGVFFVRGARGRIRAGLVVAAVALSTHAFPTAISAQTEPVPCPTGGEITIHRELPTWVPTPATFTYEVRGPDSETLVDTVSITFEEGHSGDKQELAHTPAGVAGDYLIAEIDQPPGFGPPSGTSVKIEPTECADAVSFSSSVHPSVVRVIKTETVGRRVRDKALGKWTFTLTNPQGGSVTKRTNANGDAHVLRFHVPPGPYILCESFTGWRSSLGRSRGFYRPNGDRCVGFVLAASSTKAFRVNNKCPLS